MRIGELATRSGVSVRSLRYYEEQNLLAATRSTSGQRHYGDTAVERVQLIQLLYAAGLSSKTIQDLLPCVETGVSDAYSQALLLAERDRIDRQMADLAAARRKLDEIIDIAVDPTQPCARQQVVA
ncbi:MerR family transcriptional regulator [Kineosporia sp. J2-2]|uniref:MerR family transcriptional regulator n=1 Tax=Kineosporia corallincola TaxID=2835133 RepID=A0ABS5TPT8_9ACTN|nr:MerR family transcriptional regulator [Kineosporia corallincola]MBT0773122.1 MerR family transcriptional regulator [Kineosporia corallincola]